MHSKTKAIGLALIAATATAGIAVGAGSDDEKSATLLSQIDASKPKNVILFVGDGMGDSEVTSGRYYGKGATGRLNMDKLPFRGSSLHYVPHARPARTTCRTTPAIRPRRRSPGRPASARSTGASRRAPRWPRTFPAPTPATRRTWRSPTSRARRPATCRPPRSRTRPRPVRARTSPSAPARARPIRDDLPDRGQDGRRLGSIAEQEADLGYDLILGGGRSRWEQTLEAGGSTNVLDYARTKGYTQQVGDKDGLAGITSLEDGKVLGLFNAGNMTTEFKPLFARTKAYYDANPGRDPQVQGGSPTTRCDENNRSSTNEPSLAAMTEKAIDLLKEDEDGFTLQVEGASIDKRDHAADPCGQIGELLGLDKAIGVAQGVPEDAPGHAHHRDRRPLPHLADRVHRRRAGNGAAYATLQTVDGAPMRIVYGTADTGLGATTSGSQMHTVLRCRCGRLARRPRTSRARSARRTSSTS